MKFELSVCGSLAKDATQLLVSRIILDPMDDRKAKLPLSQVLAEGFGLRILKWRKSPNIQESSSIL